jgi:3-oxoacyl-[acyl-carrier protein] reductase
MPDEAAGAVYLMCTPASNFESRQTAACGGGLMM